MEIGIEAACIYGAGNGCHKHDHRCRIVSKEKEYWDVKQETRLASFFLLIICEKASQRHFRNKCLVISLIPI